MNCTNHPLRPKFSLRLRTRRGVAVLLVLGMLAMTLALSYASLRGQVTLAQLTENLGRGETARLAAESGVYAALREMSQANWAGVGTPIQRSLSDNSRYEISFATGDEQIKPGMPLHDAQVYAQEYPFRVTISAVGYASDPARPTVQAVHKVEAVVQLARRKLLDEPAGWNALIDHTVHQWGDRDITVQEPVRVNGTAHILGRMLLSQQYPTHSGARDQYLSGLNEMRREGRGDHRPFASPLTIDLTRQSDETIVRLTKLGLTAIAPLTLPGRPADHPGTVLGYRLYRGGKSYAPPIVQALHGSTLSGVELKSDPVTNPLGIFRSRNSLSIQSNVRIKGTLISEGTTPDIQVHGTNVTIEGMELPPTEQASPTRYQLPAAIVQDDLRMHGGSAVKLTGMAVVYDEFEFKTGSPSTTFELKGNLFTNGLALRGRDTWVMTTTDWTNHYNDFNPGALEVVLRAVLNTVLNTIRTTLGLGPSDVVYFPEYMQHVKGFIVKPVLTFSPAAAGAAKPHWHTWTQPIYQKDPTDAGLRWNLIRWVEGS